MKSKDIDNIKLFKEPARKRKSRKSTGRSSLCAITGKNGRWRKNGQKLIFVIVRDGAGWAHRLRTISGETCYFYVKENSNENTVFVNERAIKLHTGAGQDTDIAATDVKYGTELTDLKSRRWMGKNKLSK